LRREITALVVTNRLIDAGGAALVPTLVAELGVPVPDVATALLIAEDLLGIEQRRAALCALGGAVARDAVYDALLEVDRSVRSVARLLVKSGAAVLDGAAIERRRRGLAELRTHIDTFLSDLETAQARAREDALVQQGIPTELARDIAMLPLADRALNVLWLSERLPIAPAAAARVYSRIGEGAGIHWAHRRLRDADAGGSWDRMVLADLRFDLLDLQRQLTESVLASKPQDPLAAADAFLKRHEVLLEQIRALEEQIGPGDGPSALVVLTSRLRGLATPQ
jgi:glutamate dehydrogenase